MRCGSSEAKISCGIILFFLDNLTTSRYIIIMKTLQVGELKSKFSKVLDYIKNGEEVIISFGKKKEKLAVIVPYSKYKKGINRKLGILKNKASFEIHEGFKISDEELLNL